jgi:hypothetical protein
MWDATSLSQLGAAVRSYDRKTTERLCEALVEHVTSHDQPLPENDAVKVYRAVYELAPAKYLWHGINAVALTTRAARDQVPLDANMDAEQVARAILATVGPQPPDTVDDWVKIAKKLHHLAAPSAAA